MDENHDYRTEAQRRNNAIHYLDFRGLTYEEVSEAMENVDKINSRRKGEEYNG